MKPRIGRTVTVTALCLETHNPEETMSAGKVLGGFLQAGDTVALMGELGAGKTVMTKGIAAGLGVEDIDSVTSPTYKVLNQYKGRLLLNHFDAYRLEGPGDFVDIGGEDLLSGNAVSVIEWGERIGNVLPRLAITVKIIVFSEKARRLEFFFDKNRIGLAEALTAISGTGGV